MAVIPLSLKGGNISSPFAGLALGRGFYEGTETRTEQTSKNQTTLAAYKCSESMQKLLFEKLLNSKENKSIYLKPSKNEEEGMSVFSLDTL